MSKFLELFQNCSKGRSILGALSPTLLCDAQNFHCLRRNFFWNARAGSFKDRRYHPRRRDGIEGDPSQKNLRHINELGEQPRPRLSATHLINNHPERITIGLPSRLKLPQSEIGRGKKLWGHPSIHPLGHPPIRGGNT